MQCGHAAADRMFMAMRPVHTAGEPGTRGTTTETSNCNGEGEEEGEGEGSTSHTNNKDWLQLGLAPSSTVRISPSNEEITSFNQPSDIVRGLGDLGHPMMMMQGGPTAMPPLPWARSVWSVDPGSVGPGAVNHVIYRGDVRVMFPPPVRPVTGVWFRLQASLAQRIEPFLPQIPRSYLRIKDGRVTVRLLTKYLVNKLGLADEGEVEISCRGHVLPPVLTLQQVRDNVWCSSREAMPMPMPLIDNNFSSTAATDHIMTLQYSRKLLSAS